MSRRVYNAREIANVEMPFVRACKKLRFLAAKFSIPQRRGAPDRLVFKGIDEAAERMIRFTHGRWGKIDARNAVREILADCLEFVELKKPSKEPEAHQLRRHAELRALGFKVVVLDSPEKVATWRDVQLGLVCTWPACGCKHYLDCG